jgi:hypothetical protein
MNPSRQLAQAEVIRREADRIVDEFPNDAPEILATDLESDAYEDQAFRTVLAIAAELRRRAAAGIRKWPGPKEF